MHGLDVAAMHIRNLCTRAELLANFGQHLFFGPRPALAGSLFRKVVHDVAIDQVLNSRGLAALAFVRRRVLPSVDLAAKLLSLRSSGLDRPFTHAPDRLAPLNPINAVV